jgi:alkyl hydroperoxide reductase subunit F
LLREIAGLSALITLREVDGAEHRKPSFALRGIDGRASIRFAGIPLGHEFSSLVLALLQVGGHPPKVDADIAAQIAGLPGEYHFESFISLSCQNCPTVVQALNLMAVLNPRVESVVIDGGLYQQEVADRQIMAVPMVFLNGELFGQGRMDVEEIVAKLDTGAATRDVAKLNAKDAYDVLIVGGGPAGAAAAVYAARKGIRTGVLAERFGGQTLDTLGIENFISVLETDGPKFAMALEQHAKQYGVDILNLQRAEKLVPAADKNGLIGVELANGATLKSRTVILSTGARWREVNVPGEKEYRNKGVAYCPHCDGPLFKGKRVAVIGGGNSGVEAAIDLAGIVGHVTLIEFGDQLRADAVLVSKLRSLSNVVVHTEAQTTEITGADGKVNGLRYTDRASGESRYVELEGVFVQIGLVPNSEWLKGTLELSRHGEIVVDARGQTSLPGVFAAGDVTTVPFKQIIIATGDGAKAALGAFDHLIRTSVPEPVAA